MAGEVAEGFAKLFMGYQDGKETDQIKVAWRNLCKRKYHLHCTVTNNTTREITWTNNTYFNSGDPYITPEGPVNPTSKMTFGVGGGSHSGDFMRNVAMGGVSGGAVFDISGGPSFAAGFTDPIIGSRKSGVALGSNPEDGYNAASGSGNTVTQDGFTIQATIDSDKRKCEYIVSGGPPIPDAPPANNGPGMFESLSAANIAGASATAAAVTENFAVEEDDGSVPIEDDPENPPAEGEANAEQTEEGTQEQPAEEQPAEEQPAEEQPAGEQTEEGNNDERTEE